MSCRENRNRGIQIYSLRHLDPGSPWKPSLHLMINLSTRSAKKELLDNEFIPFADIRQNMKELNMVNRYLGGHQITISGIKELMPQPSAGKPVTICEIGCGGGDN